MSNSYKKSAKISVQEQLGKDIVKGIREKKFSINADAPVKLAKLGKGIAGIAFDSAPLANGSIVRVSSIKNDEHKNPRYEIQIKFAAEKGSVNKIKVTGKYARLAYIAITKKPAIRMPAIAVSDAIAASKALGF